LAVGVYEVTFAEWDACVRDGGCDWYPPDRGWGRGRRPVIHVSWEDAQQYAAWLSGRTGERYRLLSEAEWEYVARAGTTTPFHTGKTISTEVANYNGELTYGGGASGVYRGQTVPVGSFPANDFGLRDVHGNVSEWVDDCWHGSYDGAPSDGRARGSARCSWRVVRGGAWFHDPRLLRSAYRILNFTDNRSSRTIGFRVARTLRP
jgi:formylglycine-generating enzyme required for sulfatase activity